MPRMGDLSVCLVEKTRQGFESGDDPQTGCGTSALVTDAPKSQIHNSGIPAKADSVYLDKYKRAYDSWGVLRKGLKCE